MKYAIVFKECIDEIGLIFNITDQDSDSYNSLLIEYESLEHAKSGDNIFTNVTMLQTKTVFPNDWSIDDNILNSETKRIYLTGLSVANDEELFISSSVKNGDYFNRVLISSKNHVLQLNDMNKNDAILFYEIIKDENLCEELINCE